MTATQAPKCRTRTLTIGDWGIERDDSEGRPWVAFHLPSVADRSFTQPVLWKGTRRDCITAVQDGSANAALERLRAGN